MFKKNQTHINKEQQTPTTPSPPRGCTGTPTMGKPRHKHANGHAARSGRMRSFLFSSLLLPIINGNPIHQCSPTMAITMRSSQPKEKPISRALPAIAPSPVERHQEQRSTRLSKSPRTTNVNPLIAELNQPGAQFNNVLEALHPATITINEKAHDDNLSNPCNLVPPTNKVNQVTPLASPTCVDLQSSNEPTPTTNKNITTSNIGEGNSPQARVRISETTETVDVNLSPAAATTSKRSILQSTTKSTSHSSNSSTSDDNASQNKTHIKEVHDHPICYSRSTVMTE